ncbi:poly-beta-1,6-N-acetyl-D-glucosamine biosynthesis protein PgaD [[Clostridium] dakarense]|uniref:poly-beta-1,6-N-acetyl-D-glucosamine biosynthesis protein PgaD n=1 Tax=Faecalimicrobium dakarense TaxID=1301100 RepID=UPI0004AF2BDF|nr:poly-beta-1,6-N-acetyl-D-glucosamine biosynthesis protein PgaD [[Clostridium] dakarense]
MEFSRPRESKKFIVGEDDFIIKSHQSFIKKIVCTVFTSLMWVYSFVIFYFFISALFDENNHFIGVVKTALKVTNYDIIKFIKTSIIIFIISFFILFCWRLYNKIRFGKLNRRSAPSTTSDEEMLNLNLIDLETYEILQREEIIVFEKNPIKELEGGEIYLEKNN